jgi:hypothetical protein
MKSHKIANNPATTIARVKIRTDLGSLELNWKVCTKVIKTKQRGSALFRQIESNAEKRKHFNLK